MVNLSLLEVGIINIGITLSVIVDSTAMYFTLKTFSLKYFLLLLFCSIFAISQDLSVLISAYNIDIGKINAKLIITVSWIIYTHSYLYFLTSYYRDLLQNWQIRLCYLINLINLTAQVTLSAFDSFELKVNAETSAKVVELTENISATSTILSETLLTIWIFRLIFKISKQTINIEVKIMLIKVIMTIILMWLMDIVVIYLEYGGDQIMYAYLTKPTVISFKFFIELLILGNCKKHLFMISGMENW